MITIKYVSKKDNEKISYLLRILGFQVEHHANNCFKIAFDDDIVNYKKGRPKQIVGNYIENYLQDLQTLEDIKFIDKKQYKAICERVHEENELFEKICLEAYFNLNETPQKERDAAYDYIKRSFPSLDEYLCNSDGCEKACARDALRMGKLNTRDDFEYESLKINRNDFEDPDEGFVIHTHRLSDAAMLGIAKETYQTLVKKYGKVDTDRHLSSKDDQSFINEAREIESDLLANNDNAYYYNFDD